MIPAADIDAARAVPLTDVVAVHGLRLRRSAAELVGACMAYRRRVTERRGLPETPRLDGAALLVVRHASPIEATTELAGADIVERRTSPPTAVEAPGMRSGDPAGTQEPGRTVGGATAPVGTDIASLLAVRRLDSPTEATTELAGDDPLAIPDFLRRAPL